MDFITDLPLSSSGCDAILVFVDKLTKYVHLVPTNKACSAAEVAKIFLATIYQYHGLPRILISDRDPRFTARFWREFCARLQVQPTYSTAFHPQTDGQTERMNRVLEEVLRHFINGEHNNWEELLPMVAFAINNSKSASTGETPFFLNHGSHPHTHVTLGLPKGDLPSLDVVFTDLEVTLKRTKALLRSAQDRQRSYADPKRRPHNFAVGDKVMISTKNFKFKIGTKKLHPKYLGPYEIESLIGSAGNAVRVTLPKAYSRIHPVFHVSLVKPYHAGRGQQPIPVTEAPGGPSETDATNTNTNDPTHPPPPIIEDGVPYYVPEAILGHRKTRKGKRRIDEFLIKWLGYDHTHNSWEPKANVQHLELFQTFKY